MFELNKKNFNLRSFRSALFQRRLPLLLAFISGCILGLFVVCYTGRYTYSAQMVLLGKYRSDGGARSLSSSDTAAACEVIGEVLRSTAFREQFEKSVPGNSGRSLRFKIHPAYIPGEMIVVIAGPDRFAVHAGAAEVWNILKHFLKISANKFPPDTEWILWHRGEASRSWKTALIQLAVCGSIGGLLGMIAGMVWVIFWSVMDKSISNIHELEQRFTLPVLGVLPQGSDNKTAGERTALHIYWKAVCSLRDHLEYCRPRRATGGILQITDLESNSGKSLLAGDLALAFAREGVRVLLIEADYRRARSWRFECRSNPGLSGVIAGTVSLSEAVQRNINDWPLDVLVRGECRDNPVALLRSRAFEDVLQQAAQFYDCILLDAPPLLSHSDALILGKLADDTLLILDCRCCSMEKLELALWRMRKASINICGMAINFFKLRNRRHYYYNYQYSFYKPKAR